MQRRHSIRHLAWRGGVAVVSQAMMFTGIYPVIPHVVARTWRRRSPVRTALTEWDVGGGVGGAPGRVPPAAGRPARRPAADHRAARLRDEPGELPAARLPALARGPGADRRLRVLDARPDRRGGAPAGVVRRARPALGPARRRST